MAYDRYDSRRDRSPDYNRSDRSGGREEERGFFERAGDEIASWFGDDEAERRRREDERMNRDRSMNRDYDRGNSWTRGRDYDRGYGRDYDRDRGSFRGSSGDFSRNRWQQGRSERDYERMGYAGQDHDYSARGGMGGMSNPDYMSPTGPSFGYGGRFGAGTDSGYGSGGYGSEYRGSEYSRDRDQDRNRDRGRDYRPMAGDYGRSDTQWGRDDYRNTSYAGSGRDSDRHYHSWRQRQLDELDNDYDRYNRERQERFENDFGTWRQNRMTKRGRLGSIREHMEVVGSDGETVGKVDKVKGDHIILTKSDSPDNRHHMLDCSMIETVEGDQVRLDIPAEEAKSRWEDADNRGFFGRDSDRSDRSDRSGPDHEANLNRSFSGTYDNES
ncbi:MAG: DUF2171 domain-containing protein [Sphingomicrobium sp.]